jgi:hypothetical protein
MSPKQRAAYPVYAKRVETIQARADNRLRAILSSWYRRPRYYRSETQHHPVPSSRQTELNREFERGARFVVWQWSLTALIVLTVIDYFYLQHWR